MKKKFLAVLLTVCMIVSMTPAVLAAGSTVVAKIGTAEYTDFGSAMTYADTMTGHVIVEICGEIEFTNGMELKGSYDSITFTKGADGAKITINQSAGGDYLEAHGKTVYFKELILAKANPAWSGNSGHMGNYFSVQGGKVTYTECTFPNGACTSGGTAAYTDCTFQNSSEYGLWVYDDALVTVTGGTIDSKKGIKVYSEDEASVTSTLCVQNTTFTSNVTSKPAVAVGYAESITLIGNTYNNTTGVLELDSGSDADCEGVTFVAQDAQGNDISSTITAIDRSKSNTSCGVLVDGKIYTTVTEAAKEVRSGDTVTLLYNSTETVELPAGVTLDTNGNTAENVTVITPVAKVDGIDYTDLQEAIKAAAPASTVEIIDDVTIDEWIMFAESMTIGNGNLITMNINGLTINGNDHTLTINSIESARNGNRLFYDAANLNINNLTIKYAADVSGGIGLQSGELNNVTIEGGVYGVLPGTGDVTIKDSTFKTSGSAIYYEDTRDNLTVTGNTFELPEDANVILLRGTETFTGNTITSGRTVNVVSGSPVVKGNTFGESVRLKVYNDAVAEITNNTITVLAFDDTSEVKSIFEGNILSVAAQAALDSMNVENTFAVTISVPTDAVIIVLDSDGNAVSAETDGTYKLVNGTYNCSVSKDGYTTKTGSFVVNGAAQAITIDLSEIVYYTVTYTDGVDGEEVFADQSFTVEADSETPAFVGTPARSGYTFTGWTPEVSAAVTGSVTYAANWSYNYSGIVAPATCTITVKDSVGGQVAASRDHAAAGTDVKVTVTPDNGYELDTLTVTDRSGNKIKLNKVSDTEYAFKMPASQVTVKAVFKEITVPAAPTFVDVPENAYYRDAVLWAVENGITTGTSAAAFSPDTVCTRAQTVTFLWRAAGCPAPKSTDMPFFDVAANAYYRDAVLWAVESGITNGTSGNAFDPDADCTRAQIVTFLWRSQGSGAAGVNASFADVENDAYYADAVSWAMESEITNGTGADTFSPEADCTRAQIVTFLWRCLKQ